MAGFVLHLFADVQAFDSRAAAEHDFLPRKTAKSHNLKKSALVWIVKGGAEEKIIAALERL